MIEGPTSAAERQTSAAASRQASVDGDVWRSKEASWGPSAEVIRRFCVSSSAFNIRSTLIPNLCSLGNSFIICAYAFRGFRKVVKSDYLLRHGWIFMKFDIWLFFENMSRKLNFHKNLTRVNGTLHEHQYTFLVIFRSVLLGMRNVSDKVCRENQNTHFVFNNFFSKIVPFTR